MPISKKLCLIISAVVPVVVACGGDAAPDATPSNTAAGAGAGQGGGQPSGLGGAGATSTATGGAGKGGTSSSTGGGGMAGSAGSAGSSGAGGAGGASGGASASGGAAGSAGAGGLAGSPAGGAGGASAFVLSSPDIERHDDCAKDNKDPCDTFDLKNVMSNLSGQNQSPELNWGAGPAGTLSYAVGFHDLSNGPNGTTHWVIWNLPATTLGLPANLPRKAMLDAPAGAQQASFGSDNAYEGSGAHGNVYEFKVYALKVAKLTVSDAAAEGAIRMQLEQSTDVLATSALRGKAP